MRDRRGVVDVALACTLWLILMSAQVGVVPSAGLFTAGGGRIQLLSGALMATPVAVRRLHPLAGFAGSCAAGLVQLAVLTGPEPIDVCFLLAVYAVAVYNFRRGARYLALAVGWAAAAVCAVRWSALPGAVIPVNHLPTLFVLLALAVTVTWTGGALIRTRRVSTEQALDRARQLEADTGRRLRLAAAQERAQIARELHDVVAHSLAVMIVQADGGRYVAAAAPDRAAAALEIVAATGRDALAQMRHLLGVLRDSDPTPPGGAARARGVGSDIAPAAPMVPAPVLDDLPALLDGVRGAGVAVRGRLPDPMPRVSGQVAAVAYRVVQEALTNVLKHVGPRAAVEVRVSATAGWLHIEVFDDGYGAGLVTAPLSPAPDGTGRGLLGMHERAALVDGQIHAGPAPGGGWHVEAVLPTDTP